MSPNSPPHISDDGALENPFWRYSLHVYERAAVRDACLALQNRYGADVNILLFLCWRADTGARALTTTELGAIKDAITPLNAHVIHPLRAARNWLKSAPFPDAQTCRDTVLAAELAGEQMAQAALYDLAQQESGQTGPGPAQVARRNLALYLDDMALGAEDFARARKLMEDLAAALFGPTAAPPQDGGPL